MKTAATQNAIRQRLLEGVLLRLARMPKGGGLVVRGGVLLAHWLRPLARPAQDLDLVAPAALEVQAAIDRWGPLFSDSSIDDGVRFEVERLYWRPIWALTSNPGVRVYVSGAWNDSVAEFQVDITGGPPPRPPPLLCELPTVCGRSACVWACRRESIVAQKIQALCHLGMSGWRPKDLADLWLLLQRLPMEDALLRPAIIAYLSDIGRAIEDGRALFAPASWLARKRSSARWTDTIPERRGLGLPTELTDVMQPIAMRLAHIWEEPT